MSYTIYKTENLVDCTELLHRWLPIGEAAKFLMTQLHGQVNALHCATNCLHLLSICNKTPLLFHGNNKFDIAKENLEDSTNSVWKSSDTSERYYFEFPATTRICI